MKIKIEHVHPPIPIRSWDYMAYDSDTYDGDSHSIVGWGSTAEAAEADFRSQWLDAQEAA